MAVFLALAAAVAAREAVRHHAAAVAPAAATTSTDAASHTRTPQPRRPAAFGINLNYLRTWTGGRAFMNLMVADQWHATTDRWPAFDPARITPDGTVRSLRPGEEAAAPMATPPGAHTGDVRIRCTWEGQGAADAAGGRDTSVHGRSMEFTWPKGGAVSFRMNRTDPADPMRHVDCREANADPSARFDPAFIAMLKPYKAIRFQGWQSTNATSGGDWSKRTLPSYQFISGPDVVSVEDMVALANQAHVDPWFMMDWKADATYLTNFARYVHTHLDPARTVYVEIGNEVWNWNFNNSHLALDEGKAEGLAPDGNGDVARMRRYAEKATHDLAIWTKEYGADRTRLVRVLAGQAVFPDLLRLALDWKDTAGQVDAIAMAPYFGYDFFGTPRATGDTDRLFRELGPKVDEAIGFVKQDKALADHYGLRLVTYEAGQHLDYRGPDQTVIARLARDPRMGDLYRRYLDGWAREAGDLMMLFTDVDGVGANTDWGMIEYPGQPLRETPKLQALLAVQREGGR